MNDPFLSFPVPYPWSHFRQTPSTDVLTTTRLNLTCITELRRWVDTPVTVTHSWQRPSGNISHSSSHPRVSNVTQVGRFYWSSIFFSSGMRASDSGIYICIVSIRVHFFCGFYFRGSRSVRENRENLHPAKISRYMVAHEKTITGLPQIWLSLLNLTSPNFCIQDYTREHAAHQEN